MDNNKKEEQPEKPKPFKLCFASQNLTGRSNVHIGKPAKAVRTIAPKFYCKYELEENFSEAALRKHVEFLKVKGPKEKYDRPVTENQRYGWYQISFCDFQRSDARLHFAKHTNPIVREHLMNYEKIR